MEAVSRNENGSFLNVLKRIWDGPNYDEAEGVSDMQFGKSNAVKSSAADDVENFKIEVKADEPVQPVLNIPKISEPGRPDLQPIKPDFQSQKPFELTANDYSAPKQTTVISKGTVIAGDLKSDGNFEIYGTVTGSITTTGNVQISGKQVGDVQGANISLSSCMVRGNITATEDMNIDSDSVIIGDLKTKNLTINGKLQGNIHAKSSVVCQSNAIVIGDLTAATITVNNGSKLQGKMQIFNGQIEDIKIPTEDQSTPTIA